MLLEKYVVNNVNKIVRIEVVVSVVKVLLIEGVFVEILMGVVVVVVVRVV